MRKTHFIFSIPTIFCISLYHRRCCDRRSVRGPWQTKVQYTQPKTPPIVDSEQEPFPSSFPTLSWTPNTQPTLGYPLNHLRLCCACVPIRQSGCHRASLLIGSRIIWPDGDGSLGTLVCRGVPERCWLLEQKVVVVDRPSSNDCLAEEAHCPPRRPVFKHSLYLWCNPLNVYLTHHIMAMAMATDSSNGYPESPMEQDDNPYPCKGCGEVQPTPLIHSSAASPQFLVQPPWLTALCVM